MKKSNLLLVIALLLTIASCTKKEENDPREKLIGRYTGRDSIINYTIWLQSGELLSSDTTVMPIEITVSKGQDNDIIVADAVMWLPTAYPYAGYEYSFISPEGERFISFSSDGTSFVLHDSGLSDGISGGITQAYRKRWATLYKQ